MLQAQKEEDTLRLGLIAVVPNVGYKLNLRNLLPVTFAQNLLLGFHYRGWSHSFHSGVESIGLTEIKVFGTNNVEIPLFCS